MLNESKILFYQYLIAKYLDGFTVVVYIYDDFWLQQLKLGQTSQAEVTTVTQMTSLQTPAPS